MPLLRKPSEERKLKFGEMAITSGTIFILTMYAGC